MTLQCRRGPQLSQLSGVRVWRRLVRNVLSRLRWLLDTRDDKVAFYHASICEFLASGRAARDCPDPGSTRPNGTSGSRATTSGLGATDRYGLEYIAHHVEW